MKNTDILEDLYLQYEDMNLALEKYLDMFNLEIINLKEITVLNNGYQVTTKHKEVLEDIKGSHINWYNLSYLDKYYVNDKVFKVTLVNHEDKTISLGKS